MRPVQIGMSAHDSYNLACIVSDQSFFRNGKNRGLSRNDLIAFLMRAFYESLSDPIFQNKTSSNSSLPADGRKGTAAGNQLFSSGKKLFLLFEGRRTASVFLFSVIRLRSESEREPVFLRSVCPVHEDHQAR